MISKIILSVFSISSVVHAQQTSLANIQVKSVEKRTLLTFENLAVLSKAVENGAVELGPDAQVELTEEMAQILNQVNQTNEKFQKPILIFKGKNIIINDKDKLYDVLATPSQTMTSA